jgi:site-specific recombinase XerD
MTEQGFDDVSLSLTCLDAVYGFCQSWINFLRGITTNTTRKTYVDGLAHFIQYLKAENPDKLLEGSATLLEEQILSYIAEQKSKGLSSSFIKTRLATIKLFYEMNRMPLSWTLIRRTIG